MFYMNRNYSRKELEEILDISFEGKPRNPEDSLGSTNADFKEKLIDKAKIKCVVEVTINVPQTAAYMRLNYYGKLCVYREIWKKLLDKFGEKVVDSRSYTENTKKGLPHLHGYISFGFPSPIIPSGLIMDIARNVLSNFSQAQYAKQSVVGNYDWLLSRFRSTSVCINYKTDLSNKWLDYIRKNAPERSE